MELRGKNRFYTTGEDTFRLRLAEHAAAGADHRQLWCGSIWHKHRQVALSKITLRRVSFQKQVLFQTVSVNKKQEAGKILKFLEKHEEIILENINIYIFFFKPLRLQYCGLPCR